MSNENDRKVLQAILNPETPFEEEVPVEEKNRKTAILKGFLCFTLMTLIVFGF